jgi:hypothetical protein
MTPPLGLSALDPKRLRELVDTCYRKARPCGLGDWGLICSRDGYEIREWCRACLLREAASILRALADSQEKEQAPVPKPTCCRKTNPCSEACVDNWIEWEFAVSGRKS